MRRELINLCSRPLIEKTRYVCARGHEWEVDVFEGANAGLILAELELDREDEIFALPPWIGREVTNDRRYTTQCSLRTRIRLGAAGILRNSA